MKILILVACIFMSIPSTAIGKSRLPVRYDSMCIEGYVFASAYSAQGYGHERGVALTQIFEKSKFEGDPPQPLRCRTINKCIMCHRSN